jgi:hypothetical protein
MPVEFLEEDYCPITTRIGRAGHGRAAFDGALPGGEFYVTYNGSVYMNPKFVGLGSQGYRCVRDAPH